MKTRRASVLTHCRRELMHQVWKLMLDDEFITAYQHGIIIRCADGVLRRVYPRIFTYSADYPEKYVQLFKCLPQTLFNNYTEFYWPPCVTKATAPALDASS